MHAWGMRHIGAIVVGVCALSSSGAAQARSMAMPSTASCQEAMMNKARGAMRHMEMPGPSACVAFRPALAPSGFRASASSATAGHLASAALGRTAHSFWESARLRGRVRLPATVVITLHSVQTVTGVQYVPQHGVGEIGGFSVSLSRDGRHFGAPVARGRWQDNTINKQVGWTPRAIRAVRVRILSTSPTGAAHVGAARFILTGVRASGGAARSALAGVHADASNERSDASAATSTNPSVVGSWGPTIGFPIDPVAAALVPGNKLVVWSADGAEGFDQDNSDPQTLTAVYDLTTGAISQSTVTNTGHDMFCPGVSILPNGNLIVTGGIGNQNTSIYNVKTGTWSAGPLMNIGRGYQGQTTLSDGQAFTLGGSWSGAEGGKLGEVYSPNGAWRELIGVPANPIYTNDAQGAYRADNHGWFIASSGGSVFQAGPSQEMHWITTTGAGSITAAGARGTAGDEMNGNAVLFDVNKILASGGAPEYQNSNATTASNVINISSGPGSQPTVTQTSPLNVARGFSNSVALPNGNVFTVGGETYPIPFDDATSVMSPELWSPATGHWTVMASQAEPRNYHSVALLLPDGRVFSGGGGLCGSSCLTNHPDGQIWSPPYLFNADGSPATRPTIVSAPASATTGQTISVTTGGPVSSFDLMRYGEATHTVDNDQRRIPLAIKSASGNTYTVTIPSDPGVALPGPYMLFAINASGTPSVAATVMVSTAAAGTPSSAYGQVVDAAGPALYWPLADASGSPATDVSGDRDTGNYSSSGVTYGAAGVASGLGVALTGGQVIAGQPQAAPSSVTEEVWFNTTSTAGGAIMGFGDSSTGANSNTDRIVYMTANGHLDFGSNAGQTNVIQSGAAYNDGNWHLVVVTQGPDGMHLYVDGKQVASNTVTGHQTYLGYFQLGGVVNNWPNATAAAFTGTIDDAAMYVSELTAGQVLSTFSASTSAGSGTGTGTGSGSGTGTGSGTGRGTGTGTGSGTGRGTGTGTGSGTTGGVPTPGSSNVVSTIKAQDRIVHSSRAYRQIKRFSRSPTSPGPRRQSQDSRRSTPRSGPRRRPCRKPPHPAPNKSKGRRDGSPEPGHFPSASRTSRRGSRMLWRIRQPPARRSI